jgi:hypothetical protein
MKSHHLVSDNPASRRWTHVFLLAIIIAQKSNKFKTLKGAEQFAFIFRARNLMLTKLWIYQYLYTLIYPNFDPIPCKNYKDL